MQSNVNSYLVKKRGRKKLKKEEDLRMVRKKRKIKHKKEMKMRMEGKLIILNSSSYALPGVLYPPQRQESY